ncbi:MAG TPA: hypothetical protein VE596_01285 [Gaiellaceae bacterium]|jgi:hypothetical protein|nr:hypothetical protein [Gaiellaceae bacterium]
MSPLFRRRPSAEEVRLANELDARGFFRYLDPEDAEKAKTAVAKDGIEAIWRVETARFVLAADPEDLAEGGIADWLEELRPALDRMGVRISEDVEQEIDESRYVVYTGGRDYAIYDLAGADAAAAEDRAFLWGLSWSRGFALLNDLLEQAGSEERAYAGSDAGVWFLTPELYEALVAELGSDRERPYVPNEQPPAFGEPSQGRGSALP